MLAIDTNALPNKKKSVWEKLFKKNNNKKKKENSKLLSRKVQTCFALQFLTQIKADKYLVFISWLSAKCFIFSFFFWSSSASFCVVCRPANILAGVMDAFEGFGCHQGSFFDLPEKPQSCSGGVGCPRSPLVDRLPKDQRISLSLKSFLNPPPTLM